MSGEAAVVTDSDSGLDSGMEERILRSMGLSDAPKADAKPAAKAPAPATPAPAQPAEAAPEGEPAAEAAEGEVAPENVIEIEFRGNRYQVPTELKELHEGYLRQEDYTRKTQETAEMRKVVELQQQQAQAVQALQQVVQPYNERLLTINSHLTEYKKVDWGAYADSDPAACNKHWMTFQSLKDQKASLEQEMQGAAAQHLHKLKDSAERLKSENSKILETKVKGWSAERDQKVRDFAAKAYGFSQQELGQVFDARLLRMMNDAFEMQSLRDAKPVKQAPPASKTLKPNATQGESKAKTEVALIRRDIRTSKTESGKAAGIQKYLERTLR